MRKAKKGKRTEMMPPRTIRPLTENKKTITAY